MKKKHDCGWRWFGILSIIVFCFGVVLMLADNLDNPKPEQGVPAAAEYTPQDLGQVFVNVNFKTPMINTLKCWDDIGTDYVEVNNTFLFVKDKRTIINKVQGLVYRIRMYELRNGLDLMENPDFKNVLNQTKEKGSHYLKCKTDMFSNDEVTAEIYDEGYKEVKILNLYRYMNIVCIYGEPYGWDCRYDDNYRTLPDEITRNLIGRITE